MTHLFALILGLSAALSEPELSISAEPALTLAEVMRSVDESFPLLEAARQDRLLARAELLGARGGFDPALRTRFAYAPLGYYQTLRLDSWVEQPTPLWGATLIGGYRLGLGNFPTYEGKLETNRAGELRFGLQLPLWRNGPIDRRRANIQRARIGQDVADLGLVQQRLESQRAAAQRYWDWVAAGARLSVAQRLLDIARERDTALAARIQRGDIPAVERTENARAIAQREAQLVAAERSLEQAAIELSVYLRDDEGQPILPSVVRLPRGLPEPSPGDGGRLEEEIQAALERRPEPRRLAAIRAQNEVELRWARNQLAPAIDVQLLVSQDLGAGSPTRERTELEAGVVLDIPLATRLTRGRIQVAEAQVARVGAQAGLARDRVVADVRDAASAMQAARARIEVTRREVSLALELERAERTRFDLGDSTLFIVNLREQASAEAALREVDALADYQRALVSFRTATGRGVSEG